MGGKTLDIGDVFAVVMLALDGCCISPPLHISFVGAQQLLKLSDESHMHICENERSSICMHILKNVITAPEPCGNSATADPRESESSEENAQKHELSRQNVGNGCRLRAGASCQPPAEAPSQPELVRECRLVNGDAGAPSQQVNECRPPSPTGEFDSAETLKKCMSQAGVLRHSEARQGINSSQAGVLGHSEARLSLCASQAGVLEHSEARWGISISEGCMCGGKLDDRNSTGFTFQSGILVNLPNPNKSRENVPLEKVHSDETALEPCGCSARHAEFEIFPSEAESSAMRSMIRDSGTEILPSGQSGRFGEKFLGAVPLGTSEENFPGLLPLDSGEDLLGVMSSDPPGNVFPELGPSGSGENFFGLVPMGPPDEISPGLTASPSFHHSMPFYVVPAVRMVGEAWGTGGTPEGSNIHDGHFPPSLERFANNPENIAPEAPKEMFSEDSVGNGQNMLIIPPIASPQCVKNDDPSHCLMPTPPGLLNSESMDSGALPLDAYQPGQARGTGGTLRVNNDEWGTPASHAPSFQKCSGRSRRVWARRPLTKKFRNA